MIDQLINQRVLLTGVNGQLGSALRAQLFGHCELITASHEGKTSDIKIDFNNFHSLQKEISALKPKFIINPAAFTNVDGAEDDQLTAFNINGKAPGVIAECCRKLDATLIHYSTDYVFNGEANTPYNENDSTEPINIYGKSKLEGENAIQSIDCKHLILRTSWVYDDRSPNFPNTIINRARKMPTLKVVNDQFGTPTWTGFLSIICQTILQKSRTNDLVQSGNRIYHLKPDGFCNWYEFANAIIDFSKKYEKLTVEKILSVNSNEFPTNASRPKWSVLDNNKIKKDFEMNFKNWIEFTEECLKLKYSQKLI